MPAPTRKVFIIAEAGVNHNGSAELATRLVTAAAASGADAVKFQAYRSEELAAPEAPKADYQIATTGAQESQFAMLKRLELSSGVFRNLADSCRDAGIEFLASPFDPDSARMLPDIGVTRLKLASGEITNGRLLLAAGATGLPVILSTGMSSLGEVEAALGALAFGYLGAQDRPGRRAFRDAYESAAGRDLLRDRVTLLHCTTEYPAAPAETNLRAMDTLRSAFGLPVGYSDHTAGIDVAIAAVARDAVVIEKHLTLDRGLPGPDHRASLEPDEFKRLVAGVRTAEAALGNGEKVAAVSERGNREIVRRSLVAARNIACGEAFDEGNLAVRRPGTGVSALHFHDWLGRRATKDYLEGEAILP